MFHHTSMCVVSILIPGPIVDDSVTVFRYFPLAADGLTGIKSITCITKVCDLALAQRLYGRAGDLGVRRRPTRARRGGGAGALSRRAAGGSG